MQSDQANAAYLSWKEGRVVESPMGTRAEGLATRSGYEYTQTIMREIMDDLILVSEEELDRAVLLHLAARESAVEERGNIRLGT